MTKPKSSIKRELSDEAIIGQFVAIKAILQSQAEMIMQLEHIMKKRQNSVFIKPTVADVKAYALSAGLKLEASTFVDHFTSNGWKVGGKAPMRDWQAAVRNFCKDKSGRLQREVPKFTYCVKTDYDTNNNESLVCSRELDHAGACAWKVK